MDLWNVKSLQAPSVNTYKVSSKEVDLKRLSTILKEAVDLFSDQKYLVTEAAVLSRVIYRTKMKFRNDKGHKAMEKTNRALKLFLSSNFCNSLSTFYEVLPKKYEAVTYMPTKDMLDYMLVRLQGVLKLLYRVGESARIATIFMQSKIRIGHFWKISVICTAMLSRIWVLTKNMIQFGCKLYHLLLPFLQHLKNTTDRQWLSNEYIFPENIQQWLGVDWLDDVNIEQNMLKTAKVDVNYDDSVVFCKELLTIESDSDEDVEIIDQVLQNKRKDYLKGLIAQSVNNVDRKITTKGRQNVRPIRNNPETVENKANENTFKGFSFDNVVFETIIDRNKFALNENTQESSKKKRKRKRKKEQGESQDNADVRVENIAKLENPAAATVIKSETKIANKNEGLEGINSLTSLKKFIKKENMKRENNVNTCVLQNLDKLQWNILRKNIYKAIKKCDGKDKTIAVCLNNVKEMLQNCMS